MAMGPNKCGANFIVVKIAVGPSAPPIISNKTPYQVPVQAYPVNNKKTNGIFSFFK